MNVLQLTEKVDNLYSQLGFEKPGYLPVYENIESLKQRLDALKKKEKEIRTLKIGIVGRVKAGKSSLLNMLFFGGKDVLPKAATPMTAALTCLRYSEHNDYRAEIECFTDKDIQEIEKSAKLYLSDVEKQYHIAHQELVEKNKSRRKPYTPTELKERAQKSAEEKHKDHPHAGAYTQSQEFKKAGKRPTVMTLKSDTSEGLMGQLEDYVGAKGKYTAYTKSVVLYLHEESLKDIEVVDTPGVNDPVKSREQRTNEFLRDCSVILAVSPASSYLDAKDAGFIGNAMTVSGVVECHLIASRCDDTILEKVNPITPQDPFDLLKELNEELGLNGRSETASYKNVEVENPETGEKQTKVKLFTAKGFTASSSIAYTLLQYLNQKTNLDEFSEHTFNQLKGTFTNTFANTEKAKKLLTELTGLQNIEGTFNKLRVEKDKILEKQACNFENPIKYQLRQHLDMVEKDALENITKLKDTDLEDAKRRETFLNDINPTIQLTADNAFQDVINELKTSIESELSRKNKQYFDSFSTSGSIEHKQKDVEEKRTRTVKKDGILAAGARFFGVGGYREETYLVTTKVNYVQYQTTPICDDIDRVRETVEEKLADAASSIRERWKNIAINHVGQALFDKLSNIPGSKKEIDANDITNIMTGVIRNLPNMSFNLKEKPSEFSVYVTLDEYDGERFIEKAKQYMAGLQNEVNMMIDHYADEYAKKMMRQNVGLNLTANLKQEATGLVQKIQDREENIKKYQQLVNDAKALNNQIEIKENN